MGFMDVIPARYAARRLPGMPLLDIAGKPMIQHVWARACVSEADPVHIATDRADLAQAAQARGAIVCMTKHSRESGNDRLPEVANYLGLDEQQVIVNVQGDEPLMPPAVIDQVAALLLAEDTPQMATLYEHIQQAEQ